MALVSCQCFARVITFVVVQVQILVDCSGDDNEEKNPETAFSNKKSALVKIIEGSPVHKTIIFCNKVGPVHGISAYYRYQTNIENPSVSDS